MITVESGKVIGVETVNETKFSEYLVTAEADLNDPIAKTVKEYYKDVNVVEKVISNLSRAEERVLLSKARQSLSAARSF